MILTPKINIFNGPDGTFHAAGIDILNADGLPVNHISVHLKIIGRGECVYHTVSGSAAVVGGTGEAENETVYFAGDDLAAAKGAVIKHGSERTGNTGEKIGQRQNTTSAGQREP